MGDQSDQQEWARHRDKAKHQERQRDKQDPAIVKTIQKEAKAAGATLANGGRGGLDPRLALAVFRRDKFRCTVSGCNAPKNNIDLDHISGHPKEIQQDPKARDNPKLKAGIKAGHTSKMAALHVICEKHHNKAHERERAIDKGKTPAPMGG